MVAANEDELFQQALEAVDAEEATPAPAEAPAEDKSLLEQAEDAWMSAGAGIAKAGFETKDFLFGEPQEADKWPIRRGVEQRAKELAGESMVNSVTMGVSQIVTGLIGAGKLLAPVKALQKSRVGFELVRGALAGGVVVDPHEARLSDLVESYPALQNPVTDYLASDPSDSAAEGRFKNALEGIGVDIALVSAVKAIRWMRAGKPEEAAKEIKKLERAEPLANAHVSDVPPGAATNDNAAWMGVKEPANDSILGPKGSVRQADIGVRAGDDPGAIPPGAANQNEVLDTSKLPSSGPANDNPSGAAPRLSGNRADTVITDDITESLGTKPTLGPNGQRLTPPSPAKPALSGAVSDDQLGAILKGVEADQSAITKFGSREAAEAAGHKFDISEHIPWQRIRSTDESMSFLDQTAKVLADRYNMAKGGARLGDARVRSIVDQLSSAYNVDPDVLLGEIVRSGAGAAQSVPYMEAAFRIGSRMFMEASNLARDIQLGKLDAFGGSAEKATLELKARLAAASDVMGAGLSVSSNAGRALRRNRKEFRDTWAALDKIKDFDAERLGVVMEKAGGDPSKLLMMANATWQKRVMGEMQWHLTNGLLWLWPTHVVNLATNAYMLAARPGEKLFGSAALRLVTRDPAKRAALSSVSRQALREYTYTIASLADGWANAVEAFRRGDSILSPHNTEVLAKETAGITPEPLAWRPVQGTWDIAYNAWQAANYRTIVGLPTRLSGSADEFFKQLRFRSVVQSRAALEAADMGLTGDAARRHIQQSLKASIDEASGQALDANALREAQTATFQRDLDYATNGDLGSVARVLQRARQEWQPIGLILPFIKTPR